jgi:peptidoglycan/LPS O-acetylase OafA/YrhL
MADSFGDAVLPHLSKLQDTIPSSTDFAKRYLTYETGYALLPSYFQLLVRPPRGVEPLRAFGPRKLHKTSWLDGLRGVASLIVVVYHYFITQPTHPMRPYYLGPYDLGGKKKLDPMLFTNPLQLPFIRLLHSGDLMVPIFFVISGYVLSFRQVKMINRGEKAELLDLLFSSVFRRGIRLFCPVAATVAMVHVGSLLGFHQIYKIHWSIWSPLSPLWHYFQEMWDILWLSWGVDFFTDQVQQLWTIPAEFACSMLLFIFQLGVSGLQPVYRIAASVIGMITVLFMGHWGFFLFLSGWLIAEFEYAIEHSRHQPDKEDDGSANRSAFWTAMFIFGAFLGSYPTINVELSMFLYWLPSITPEIYMADGYQGANHFWQAIAALLLVWPIFRIPELQAIFTTPVAQYLGDISFALYLVHYQLVIMGKDSIRQQSSYIFGTERPNHLTRTVAWAFELAILLFFVLWQADVCWRFIDRPSVKAAKWIEKKVRRNDETDTRNSDAVF